MHDLNARDRGDGPIVASMPGADHQASRDGTVGTDLGAAMAALRLTREWRSGPRAAASIFHSGRVRAVVTVLHQAAEMHNDDPDEAITIQGLHGSALISVDGRGAVIDEGTLVGIPAGSRWRLVATTEAAVLLTVVPS
jgi:quercetin dioxygenase-like cupin family protein